MAHAAPRSKELTAHCCLAAPWGTVELAADAGGLVRLELRTRRPQLAPAGPPAACEPQGAHAQLARAAAAVSAYLEDHEPFPPLPLHWEQVSPFARRIYRILRTVAYGTRITYGELGARAGRPGAARAVGRAMAQNPWPLVIPCHRVLPAAGGLGGYGPGPALKGWLLDHEARGDV